MGIYVKYQLLFESLKSIVKESEKRVLRLSPDLFFVEHVNFLVKSYLICSCTYLESYLKDVANAYISEMRLRIDVANLPRNLLHWDINKDVKDKDQFFEPFRLSINSNNIDDNISANPFKTVKLFRLLGVNLEVDEDFKRNKDIINAIVEKRNSIIHHNDSAADISFGDLINYMDVFNEYMNSVNRSVNKSKF